MQMSDICVQNDKIATYQSSGVGRDIFFIHGNSADSFVFKNQLEGDFGAQHHVYSLDLPGCGLSNKAKDLDSTYSLQGLADVVTTVIDHLQLKHPIVVGHSLGGHLLLRICQKVKGLSGCVIFGAPPVPNLEAMAEGFLPSPAVELMMKGEVNNTELNLWVSELTENPETRKVIAEKIKSTDPNFRTCFGNSLMTSTLDDEMGLLNQIDIPIAIFHGEFDKLVNLDYLEKIKHPNLWKHKIHVIKNSGHFPQFDQPEVFNQLLTEFIEFY